MMQTTALSTVSTVSQPQAGTVCEKTRQQPVHRQGNRKRLAESLTATSEGWLTAVPAACRAGGAAHCPLPLTRTMCSTSWALHQTPPDHTTTVRTCVAHPHQLGWCTCCQYQAFWAGRPAQLLNKAHTLCTQGMPSHLRVALKASYQLQRSSDNMQQQT